MDVDVHSEISDESNSPAGLYSELEDPEIIVKLGNLAATIAYYNFEWRFVTLIIYNTLQHIGVESFLMTYNQSIYLKFGRWLPRHRVHVPQFVVFGEETADLTETLQWLVDSKYDNTAMFIIICSSKEYKRCDENHIFETLSRLNMVNVFFLKRFENATEPLAFSYDPVLPVICRNKKPHKIDLPNCRQSSCFKNLYPEKLKNLYKCPFIISTLEQPPFMQLRNGVNGTLEAFGADGDLINTVSTILNGTLVIRKPADGEWGHFENNNWTGSLGDVYNRQAYISLCWAPLTSQLHGNFQISYPHASIDMVWAARLPSIKPSWENLLYPIKVYTRIALLFVFFIVILIHIFLKTRLWKNLRSVLQIGQTNVSLFFYSWFVFLGMPLMRFPSRAVLRAVIIHWIWFCYILRTAYQAALLGSMKLLLYEDYLENFAEVIQNNYTYGGSGSLRDYYSEDSEVTANWVYVKYSKAGEVLDSVVNGSSDFVIALNKEFIVQHLVKYNGTRRVQIIPEKIVNSPAVLYFKKFSPFRAPVSHIMTIMVEAGLVDMLYSRYKDRENYLLHHEVTQPVEPLTTSHVSSSFIILFVGWSLSILYFAIEVLAKKYESKNIVE